MPSHVEANDHVAVLGGRIEGEVLVNGHPQEAATLARISGYVSSLPLCISLVPLAGIAIQLCSAACTTAQAQQT